MAVLDAGPLALRLILGVIFISHGWDKIFMTASDKPTVNYVAAGLPQLAPGAGLLKLLSSQTGYRYLRRNPVPRRREGL